MTQGTKRATKGNGSIRQNQSGNWEVRYTVGRDPRTGGQFQKSKSFKTKKEAARFLRNMTNKVDDDSYIEPSKLTLGEYLDRWLEKKKLERKQSTISSYKTQIEAHIKPAIGGVKMSEIHKATQLIQKMVSDLYKAEKHPLSGKSIKNLYSILCNALKDADAEKLIVRNPLENSRAVKRPSVKKKEIACLEYEQIAPFLDVIKGSEYEAIIKFTMFTGLRQGEAIGLTWDRVNFDAGTVKIDRQMMIDRESHEYTLQDPKTKGSERVLYPAPFVMDILRECRRQQAMNKLRLSSKWDEGKFKGKGLVFTNEFGGHLCPNTLTHNVKRFGERIGVHMTFHALRHTNATLMLAIGDDPNNIRQNLGHNDIRTTFNIYIHHIEKAKAKSAELMQSFYTENIAKGG